MTCTRVDLGPGAYAVVCGRGNPRPRRADDEAVILEDVRRHLAAREAAAARGP